MAVTAKLHLRDGVTGDAREIRSRDVWIVGTDPPSGADTSNPTGAAARAAGLPSLFTAGVRPDAPTLIADCYESCISLDAQVGQQWQVVIRYSNTARFRFNPQRDKTNISYKTIQDSSSRQIIEVPYFSVSKVDTTPTANPTNAPPALRYTRGVQRYDLSLSNPQVRVNVNTFTFNDRQYILSQKGKYHRLDSQNNGPLSKFVAYNVQEQAENLWTIVYQWIQDPGGPTPIDVSANGVAYADGTPLLPDTTINTLVSPAYRAAFESYVIIPSRPGDLRPRIRAIRQYADSDVTGYNGAHNLPGSPV